MKGATPIQRRGMAFAVGTQCLGSFAAVFVNHGLFLLYLLSLNFEESLALALTGGFHLMNFTTIFFAQWAEKKGLKWVGGMGLILIALGFGTMGLVYFIPQDSRLLMMLFAMGICAIGKPAYASIFFPLIRGVVPEALRGRFFGVLRFSWQLTGLAFLMICPFLVGEDGDPSIYALLLGGIAITQLIRFFVLSKIPDTQKSSKTQENLNLYEAVRYAIHWPGFSSFCAYVFLMSFATGITATSYALSEKMTLHLSDATVVGLGNLGLLGTILGALFGGMIIDRYGTKVVFIVGHFGIGGLMFLFVARGVVPLPNLWTLGLCHSLTGLLISSVMLGVTTEMFSLEPDKGKNVAFSIVSACTALGGSLSGVLGAGAVKIGLLQHNWEFLGENMGAYDGLLLILSGAVMMLVVTLCLVPSVLKAKPHRIIPQA